MQVVAEQQAANIPVNDVPVPSTAASTETHKDTAMDVDAAIPSTGEEHFTGKRKAEDEGQAEGSKKARVGTSFHKAYPIWPCRLKHLCTEAKTMPLKR